MTYQVRDLIESVLLGDVCATDEALIAAVALDLCAESQKYCHASKPLCLAKPRVQKRELRRRFEPRWHRTRAGQPSLRGDIHEESATGHCSPRCVCVFHAAHHFLERASAVATSRVGICATPEQRCQNLRGAAALHREDEGQFRRAWHHRNRRHGIVLQRLENQGGVVRLNGASQRWQLRRARVGGCRKRPPNRCRCPATARQLGRGLPEEGGGSPRWDLTTNRRKRRRPGAVRTHLVLDPRGE
mmetsp:Transcript_70795/g.179221  ORF Transcript_70795/g.179221 Transcript_70795/m.179221 type:complete len:244 (+) Transcript_70795:532-1263(+)